MYLQLAAVAHYTVWKISLNEVHRVLWIHWYIDEVWWKFEKLYWHDAFIKQKNYKWLSCNTHSCWPHGRNLLVAWTHLWASQGVLDSFSQWPDQQRRGWDWRHGDAQNLRRYNWGPARAWDGKWQQISIEKNGPCLQVTQWKAVAQVLQKQESSVVCWCTIWLLVFCSSVSIMIPKPFEEIKFSCSAKQELHSSCISQYNKKYGGSDGRSCYSLLLLFCYLNRDNI